MLFLLSDDLMTTSRVQGAAAGANVKLATVGSLAALLQSVAPATDDGGPASRDECTPLPFVLIDLQTRNVDWVKALSELKHLARVLVFGPHVWKEPLEIARRAGCDYVLTNGEFFGDMARWLQCGNPPNS